MQNLHSSLYEALSPGVRKLAPNQSVFNAVPHFMQRVAPANTLTISLTDSLCEQQCAHCNGHYLKGMQPFSQLSQRDLSRFDSVLISGGSSADGKVPIDRHIADILALPDRLRLNLHTGYLDPEVLAPLKSRNPVISFDLPTSDAVVKEVYGLNYSCKDFRNLYEKYCAAFKTVAHVTLGLAAKEHEHGEEETVEYLGRMQPAEVAFLVFRPTPGTRMADVIPPSLSRVIPLLSKAISLLNCPVQIGCMRPAGTYRRDFDILAWMHGCRKFVMPDHRLLQILEEHQVKVVTTHNCCAFAE